MAKKNRQYTNKKQQKQQEELRKKVEGNVKVSKSQRLAEKSEYAPYGINPAYQTQKPTQTIIDETILGTSNTNNLTLAKDSAKVFENNADIVDFNIQMADEKLKKIYPKNDALEKSRRNNASKKSKRAYADGTRAYADSANPARQEYLKNLEVLENEKISKNLVKQEPDFIGPRSMLEVGNGRAEQIKEYKNHLKETYSSPHQYTGQIPDMPINGYNPGYHADFYIPKEMEELLDKTIVQPPVGADPKKFYEAQNASPIYQPAGYEDYLKQEASMKKYMQGRSMGSLQGEAFKDDILFEKTRTEEIIEGIKNGTLSEKEVIQNKKYLRNHYEDKAKTFLESNNFDVTPENIDYISSKIEEFTTETTKPKMHTAATTKRNSPEHLEKKMQLYQNHGVDTTDVLSDEQAQELKKYTRKKERAAKSGKLKPSSVERSVEKEIPQTIDQFLEKNRKDLLGDINELDVIQDQMKAKALKNGVGEGAEKAIKKQTKNNADDVAKKLSKTKVGRIAAAIGVGALVVSNMNKNKGQQPNAQLYGQQTPYSY